MRYGDAVHKTFVFCPLAVTRALLALVVAHSLVGPVQAAEPMVFRRGNLAEPVSLDPVIVETHPESSVTGDIFMGLTTEDPASRPIPGMAESWTTSDDGLVWTFKLRAGIKWSDGVPVTAADFVFGFRRLMDPKTAAKYASLEYVIKNAEEVNSGKLPLEDLGVRAIDDRTFEITLSQQAPFLPGLMKHHTAYPAPEHTIKKFGDAWVKPEHIVSNGPYRVAEWKPNEYVKLVKNPLFFDAANVKIDEVYFYPINDESVALSRFRAGGLDANIGNYGFPAAQADWLAENMPGQAITTPSLSNGYLAPNMRRPPFNDQRVRRAVSLCTDRELLATKVMRDGRVPAYSFVPPGTDNYLPQAKVDFADWPVERRRAEAKRLLAEAGYGPDHPLVFEYKFALAKEPRRMAIGLSALWKECGIVGRLVGNELRIHYAGLREHDFDMGAVAWVADYNDPQAFLFLLDSRSGGFNYAGYANLEFDRLIDESKSSLDLEKRAQVLARAEQIALDESAAIPLAFTTSRELVASYVKGFVPNAEDFHRTRFMWLEPH